MALAAFALAADILEVDSEDGGARRCGKHWLLGVGLAGVGFARLCTSDAAATAAAAASVAVGGSVGRAF